MKILGRVTSINVRKVMWAADELGLSYEREDWGLPIRDPAVPEFLALNPNALVPVLIEDGFVLWESHPIMRYLAEQHDGGLIPRDARARALMEQWLGWQATELTTSWAYAFRALGRPTPGYDDPGRIDASIAAWSKKMAILEGQLADGRPYVNGAEFSLADIALGVSVHRWVRTPFDRPAPLPALEAYYERLRVRPAASAYLGPETP
ncbi:MAG TPA: glutathione S-transferase family protein [Devosiaceae bacterium]|nr:glutathione S-transferase family protein [Devosiaceae bacterium]